MKGEVEGERRGLDERGREEMVPLLLRRKSGILRVTEIKF